MINPGQPSNIFKPKQVDAIRDQAAKAEKDGKLTRAQLTSLYEQNFFSMLAPSTYGGSQMNIPDALQILESLSWTDGSLGWMAVKGAVAGWATGFVNAEGGKAVLTADKMHVSGTDEIGGTAEKTKTGYTISGKWQHVAGFGDATAFIAHCTIKENGDTIKDDAHREQVISFLLSTSELALTPCNSMGLSGAGCVDVEVINLKVPANRAFILSAEHAIAAARLYQYPYLQLSEAAHAAAVCGIANRFNELSRAMLETLKDKNGNPVMNDNMVQDTLEKYGQKMSDARIKLYYAAELTWQACTNQQAIKDTILYKVSAAAQDMTRKAREFADAIMPFCGLCAMDKNAEINRVWRDLHTACQEPLIVFGGL